jgi:AraC-like DNA-binding protein
MSEPHLYLGWRTAALGLVALQIIVLAVAILTTATNRTANRFLGAALIVIAGLLTPYAIGFAGAYDVWRELTFAPFAIPLAMGPLLYAYASALDDGRPPQHMIWHFAPPLAQAAYFAVCFLLPIRPKWAWYTGGHETFVAPFFSVLTLISLAGYAWAIGRVLGRYRTRLADQRSDDDRYSAVWLTRVQTAILFGLMVEIAFWLWATLTGGIDYFQETGLYVALGALGLYLGVAGWRHAGLPAPLATADSPASVVEATRAVTDWSALAAGFAERTREEGWWREPDLTLPRLARRLGTNSGRLSRAINLGLGVNFSAFINALRAEAVADALQNGRTTDLLDLALDMGFASKASFNRAFRARYGMAPSQFRRRVSDPEFSTSDAVLRRTNV